MHKVYITSKSFAIIISNWAQAQICILPLENVWRYSHDFFFINTSDNLSVKIFLGSKIESRLCRL